MTNFDGNGAIEVARGERAIIAVPELPREGARRSADARIEEAEGLSGAIGINVVAARSFRVRAVRPATLLGKGQVEEIAELSKQNEAGLLIIDAALTPIQQKNLEEEVGTKVIDRTGTHSRDFWRTCRNFRRTLAGRARASRLSGRTARKELDPS